VPAHSGTALARRNPLFAGSDDGGATAAVLDSIVSTCKQIGVEPCTYLRDVLTRLPAQPADTRHELLPAAWVQARCQNAEPRPCPTPPGATAARHPPPALIALYFPDFHLAVDALVHEVPASACSDDPTAISTEFGAGDD
jgi:hypothetical protein